VTGIQTLKKTVGIIQNLGTVLKIKSRILAWMVHVITIHQARLA
jgi:hypothetical protein